MKAVAAVAVAFFLLCCRPSVFGQAGTRAFEPVRDLISLHYDHAPDKDDGQSAAADRTILQAIYAPEWIKAHVVAVSGAYGRNAAKFNADSDRVMDAVWSDCGGWLAAHANRERAIAEATRRWIAALKAGGDVWVKEGGQSDFTADVVRAIRGRWPELDTTSRIHVVQHSQWNEDQTTEAALTYTRKNTHYVRIRDANTYLNVKGGDAAFVAAALQHPAFASFWKAAFAYYPPRERLDFSDTGELMHILGLGEMGIDTFRRTYLSGVPRRP